MPRERNETFQMRLRADEVAKLRALADDRDESASALLRRFIRERYAARVGGAAPTKRRARR